MRITTFNDKAQVRVAHGIASDSRSKYVRFMSIDLMRDKVGAKHIPNT